MMTRAGKEKIKQNEIKTTKKRKRRRRRQQQCQSRCLQDSKKSTSLPGTFASFCVRCRRLSPTFNRTTVILKNGASALRGNCTFCHAVKFRFMNFQEFMSRIIASTVVLVTVIVQNLFTDGTG